MCYLHRQEHAQAQAGDATAAPGHSGVRPRWAGASALLLIGGFAVAAALVDAPAPPASAAVQQVAAPVATRAAALPTGSADGLTSLPADDGVPTRTGIVKAGAGNCQHGM